MFQYHTTLLALFYLCIVRHLTLSAPSDTIGNQHKTQYMIVYMTSESSLAPIAFETSFNIFGASLRSVISEALPSLSTSFNMTQINLWCLPDSNDLTLRDYGYGDDLYSSFYIKIEYDSVESNGNDVLLPIVNRMNNDLFPQLLIENIKTIDTHSPLIHPQHFKFEIYDIIIAKNDTFIVEGSDCISYLIDIQKKSQISSIVNTDDIINHDDDDFVEFLFYGFTVHWKTFVIYSVICVVIGMSICCAIVCFHVNLVEKKRKKLRRMKKRRKRSRNSYFSSRSLDQTPSCVGSITDLTPIVIEDNDDDLMNIYHDDDNQDLVAIIRSPPCSSTTTSAAAISRRNVILQKVKSNSVTIDSEQSQLIRQQYIKNMRKRAVSCRGYDKLNHFDDDDELKQEELFPINALLHEENQNNDDETEKIVTVHVHHHYNPNGENVANRENYPDLPFEAQHINNNNDDYVALHSPPSEHNIANILAIANNKDALKEPSKSQREGFSPFTVQQQVIRKSVVSQQEDHMSDSELMYLPGPAADDTPGKNTPHDADRTM